MGFMNVFLGIPLEGLHGFWKMVLMYNCGVIGGALCYSVGDAHTRTVGMSGGCYCLIGMTIADLIMNWHQKKFRILTTGFLAVLIGIDMVSYYAGKAESTSHSAHMGGAIAGTIVGVVIGN